MAQTAGYSGKSLADKLGLKPGVNICIINAPDNYDDLIDDWPVGASVTRENLNEVFTFIHYFVTERAKLESDLPALVEHLDKSGMLWISWPKQARVQGTGVRVQKSDLNENVLREVILPTGLVDVKVAAVDDTWSALKFVRRKSNR